MATNGKYLLDTNVVIAIFAEDEKVLEQLEEASEIFVPSIVVGELFFGARKSGRAKENVKRVEEFSSSNVILACDVGTARWYAQIKDALRLKGKPIPENDIWIAALALQYDLVLVTRDAHFKEVEGLSSQQW